VADGNSGLLIFNLSNPASPTLLGSYNTPGSANGVAVSGTIAYVADYALGLQIIDVSNPGESHLDWDLRHAGSCRQRRRVGDGGLRCRWIRTG
jgi:hypothetical protein